jgi:hypothetical protein
VIQGRGIARPSQNSLSRWVRRVGQFAEYGWFENRKKALEWMWEEGDRIQTAAGQVSSMANARET